MAASVCWCWSTAVREQHGHQGPGQAVDPLICPVAGADGDGGHGAVMGGCLQDCHLQGRSSHGRPRPPPRVVVVAVEHIGAAADWCGGGGQEIHQLQHGRTGV